VTVANNPVVATTRLITAASAGDTSDWLEIATYGDYSLIVRKNELATTVSSVAGSDYSTSPQHTAVNTWFAGTSTLGSGAALRNYAVQNTALTDRGAFSNRIDGFSKPKVGTLGASGNDIAFLPSFAEFAGFLSLKYHPNSTPYPASPAGAQTNYRDLIFNHSRVEIGRSTGTGIYLTSSLRSPTDPESNLRGLAGGAANNYSPPYYIRPMIWIDNEAGADLFESR
jgi:hypothetical protein